jgi:hypothetical protein
VHERAAERQRGPCEPVARGVCVTVLISEEPFWNENSGPFYLQLPPRDFPLG